MLGSRLGLARSGGCCCTAGPSLCTCGACTIPQGNLTLSWTNLISGPGSATLVYQSCTSWTTGCVGQNQYQLTCSGGTLIFTAIYQLSGACPTGQQSNCVSNGVVGHKLDSTSLTCGASFLWQLSVNGTDCPTLASNGFTSFTISI